MPPPTYHPQRPESHEESPSYSWYKNAYFRSFLKTDSPIGCIVTLHWLHDRAFGTLSLRENDLSSIFVRYFIHIRSGVRCEKYYGSSMFVLERPLSSAGVSILMSYGENPHYVKLPIFSEFMENSTKFMKNSDLTKWTQNLR